MTKNTRKPPPSDSIEGVSALKMASDMLETGLSGLREYVDATSSVLGDPANSEAAENFAHVLTKIAQVASELRKAAAAERKAAEGISKAEVMDWARRMDPTERARFVRELQQIDSRKSGLA